MLKCITNFGEYLETFGNSEILVSLKMAYVHTGTSIVLVQILVLLPKLKQREVGYLTYKECQVFQGKLMGKWIGKLCSVATSLSACGLFQGVARHTASNQQKFAIAVYTSDVFYSLHIIIAHNYQVRRI